jgi:hypothetical protein
LSKEGIETLQAGLIASPQRRRMDRPQQAPEVLAVQRRSRPRHPPPGRSGHWHRERRSPIAFSSQLSIDSGLAAWAWSLGQAE